MYHRSDGSNWRRHSLVYDESPNTLIGRYQVLGELGSGGMGTVYEAYDPGPDRREAVKLLDSQTSTTSRRRLKREARPWPNCLIQCRAGLRHRYARGPGISGARTLAQLFATQADRHLVTRAVTVVRALAPIDYCGNVEILQAAIPPPEDPTTRRRVEALQPRVTRNAYRFLDRVKRFSSWQQKSSISSYSMPG